MQVVTAIFPDRDSAVATRDTLGKDHYSFRWLAVTKPVDHADADSGASEAHEVSESSDGALGALGRFLSGGGSSLQRALMDHNVTREDAETVDSTIGLSGAVLVIHASNERAAEAGQLLEAGGGHVVSITTSGTVPPVGTAPSPGFHATDATDPAIAPVAPVPVGGTSVAGSAVVTPVTTLDAPLDHEELFTERRVPPSTLDTSL